MEEAAFQLKPEEFFALRLLTAIGAFLITTLFGFKLFISLPAVLVGYWLPKAYMERKRKKRMERCSYQLVEALGTMTNALRAGFSFIQSVQLIAREIPDPLGTEFTRLAQDISLGVPLEEALQQLHERLPVRDLELVLTALIIQRTTGGNLAELLETMQETMKDRVRIKEELKTLTAQGRMSSWIISLLPVVIALYLNLVNPTYFGPMLEHPIGWLMLIISGMTCIIGWLVIRKIVQIEV